MLTTYLIIYDHDDEDNILKSLTLPILRPSSVKQDIADH